LFLAGIHETDNAQIAMRKMLTRDPDYEMQSPPPWRYFQERVNRSEYIEPFTTVMEKGSGEERELGKLYLHYLAKNNNNESKKLEQLGEKGGLMAKVLALKVLLDRDAPASEVRSAVARLPEHLGEFGAYAYVLRGDARTRLALFNEAQQDFHLA